MPCGRICEADPGGRVIIGKAGWSRGGEEIRNNRDVKLEEINTSNKDDAAQASDNDCNAEADP